MSWVITEDLDDYLAAAGDYLRLDPVRNTIPLTAAQTLRVRGPQAFGRVPPLFGWWRAADGEITAVLLHTPPYPILLTGLPERSARPLAAALVARHRDVPASTPRTATRRDSRPPGRR